MSKKIGSGIWERPVDYIRIDQPLSKANSEMLRKYLLSLKSLDQRLSELAALSEAVVSSMSSDPLGHTPMQQAVKKWLSTYRSLCSARSNADLEQILELSFWLGELSEELRWRWDFVPDVKASPEELAVERNKSRVAFASKNEGRDKENRERARAKKERLEYAREKAAEYRSRKPRANKTEIARHIRKTWDLPEQKPTERTIRSYLKK